ncbi:MAG: basal-body rod modification protein flgD [Fibrobacterota bacterium]|jgi:flagellar hook assembly protein FlgD
MSTTATATGAPDPLDLQDYFAKVKDGSWKSSATDKGELASKSSANKGNGNLDKDAFMNMLVTQLKFQDPLAPQDNQQMAAQMAQFSSLEAMQNVQKGVDKMGTSIEEMTNTQSAAANSSAGTSASNLLGKAVSIRQEEVALAGAAVVSLPVQGSSTSNLVLKDQKGVTVRTIPLSGSNPDGSSILGAKGQGTVQIKPLDDAGAPIQGTFTVSVEDALGKTAGSVYQKGVVEGISYKDGIPFLAIGNGTYKLSDLLTVMPVGAQDEGTTSANLGAEAVQGLNPASAATFLGKTVSVKSPEVQIASGVATTLKLIGDPGSSLVLVDAKGAAVRTIPLSGKNSDGTPIMVGGSGSVQVDPVDSEGMPMTGHFTAKVVDAQGKPSGSVYQQGKVDGLEFKDGVPYLSVAGNNYKPSELLALSADTSTQGVSP